MGALCKISDIFVGALLKISGFFVGGILKYLYCVIYTDQPLPAGFHRKNSHLPVCF
jgi:hypothetical protein